MKTSTTLNITTVEPIFRPGDKLEVERVDNHQGYIIVRLIDTLTVEDHERESDY